MRVTVAPLLETARAAFAGEIVVIGEAEGATPLSALMAEPLEAQAPVDAARDGVVLPCSSGTTGLPKGVRLSHRSLVANVDQCLTSSPAGRGRGRWGSWRSSTSAAGPCR